jgi:class 3 adenylate cyclase
MTPLVPSVIVALVSLGMAAAFYGADRASPTSRVLALAFATTGLSYALDAPLTGSPPGHHRSYLLCNISSLLETVSLLTFLEWILRVRRTIPSGELDTRVGDYALRFAQGVSVLYGICSVLLPQTKVHDFLGGLQNADALMRPGFWLFAVPMLFVLASGAFALLLLLHRRPDRPEKLRAISASVSGPFLVASLVLPNDSSAVVLVIGQMIFLVGAVQYHVLQGRRGAFMSRFLSPQVAELVRMRGMDRVIQHQQSEITIVCCDLRGFTDYARARFSGDVIELLREYYDAAGEAAAEVGATIKDFAGDGVLLLVGAPVAQPDHAARGLELARRLRDSVSGLTGRWSIEGHRLGVGLGVASGMVTVGVINSVSRLEYTAVGAAVNLASRLCERAVDGEILADEQTIQLAAATDFKAAEPVELQGFSVPMPLFASKPETKYDGFVAHR